MKATPKPCDQCPFRKIAPPGWLGPWKGPEELLIPVLGEAGFICHMTLKAGHEKTHRLCAGSLICANKSFKTYRDPDLYAEQIKFGRNVDVLDAQEFIAHHKKTLEEYLKGNEK